MGSTVTASAPLDIQVLPTEAADDPRLMRQITDLVNRVYATAENGQWLPGTNRTSVDEVTRFARAGEIVVARQDGVVVGSIRVRQFDGETGEIGESGMLVADPDRRGMAIGRALRAFVVDLLRRRGMTTLRIELLTPRNWDQPSKRFMADWNARSGYQVVGKGAFEEEYPDLAPLLATPCDFVVYHLTL
jgi:GNAT superfamily N-acetyltransferase